MLNPFIALSLLAVPPKSKKLAGSLPNCLEVTHISLFDNSIEGIRHKSLPIFSVQYHPEASPGPTESSYLFNEFLNLIKESKNAKKRSLSNSGVKVKIKRYFNIKIKYILFLFLNIIINIILLITHDRYK